MVDKEKALGAIQNRTHYESWVRDDGTVTVPFTTADKAHHVLHEVLEPRGIHGEVDSEDRSIIITGVDD